MDKQQLILNELKARYSPVAALLYGSYADGTYDEDSDFDVLLITDGGEIIHDNESVIEGVTLDAFVYPIQAIKTLDDPFELIQLCHSRILFDTDDHLAQSLVGRIRAYADAHANKPQQEKLECRAWAQKMLRRSRRADAEGLFRAHWLLTDSLEFYCIVRDQFYFGPKKTLISLAQNDPHGYALYDSALRNLSGLDKWIQYVFSPMRTVS